MPLKLIRDDITKLSCDAIVNAAKKSLLGGGGVDGAIHKAAGIKLLLACRKLHGCETGEAKITAGYSLPSKYVIHTVGPVWKDGLHNEENLLRSCYRNSLAIAKEYNLESIAFPLISSGAYGYPKDQALHIAIDEISTFLLQNEMLVYLVVFDKDSYKISEKLFSDISSFIDDRYVDENLQIFERNNFVLNSAPRLKSRIIGQSYPQRENPLDNTMEILECRPSDSNSLRDALENLDESFSEMLLRKIDEKGMDDPECYKKANIDRKLFSKIKSDKNYKPSKTTVLAFAIALELSLSETKDMLEKAGFAISHSNKFDIIIEYFITNGNYNIFEINEALFAFDQKLLGV